MPPLTPQKPQVWRVAGAKVKVQSLAAPEPWLGGGIDRRRFLVMVEAALAAAGLAGCTLQPPERALPYTVAPASAAPDQPLYYGTTMPYCGYGLGVVGKTTMGRPIKIDGHPGHPGSLGRSNIFMQASLLSLYDPDRTRAPSYKSSARTWAAATSALRAQLETTRSVQGEGVYVLTETVTSPSLAAQIQRLLAAFPRAKWCRYEPLDDRAARTGAELAFGRPVDVVYHFDRADRVVALSSDFLSDLPGSVRYAWDYSRRRDFEASGSMSRLYVAEAVPTITGAAADHRLIATPQDIAAIVAALAARLRGKTVPPGPQAAWTDAAAADLLGFRGKSLVVVGREQPAAVHAAVHAINGMLGNFGTTVTFAEAADQAPVAPANGIGQVARALAAGEVKLLLNLGGNPVYTAPRELSLRELWGRAAVSAHLAMTEDETALASDWHLPESHYLEAWGDLRAFDGTASLVQPLLRPLYQTRSALEVVAALQEPETDGYSLVRSYWQAAAATPARGAAEFEAFWLRALQSGSIAGSAQTAVLAVPDWRLTQFEAPAAPPPGSSVLLLRPDPTILDGRYGNNGWLQETPKPLSTLTWDNALQISPAQAQRLAVVNEELVDLRRADGAVLRAAVLVVPGQADGVLSLALGYGRRAGGKFAIGRGFDAAALRADADHWQVLGVTLVKASGTYPLALTQLHQNMEAPSPVEVYPVSAYSEHPNEIHHALVAAEPAPSETLYPPTPQGDYAWGMSLDLNQCIGCNACSVACQAENNISIVGKEQVALGRIMHWIRVDQYFAGPPAAPEVYHQPVPCMHCEKAPCEVVCPVGATLHDKEGLNEMVYNRCVGTRYCSNNCPYKVRRFNFLRYAAPRQSPASLAQNPDVTVRDHGVMEKCTYCVQRINAARIGAEKEGRRIHDGEVVPACAAACPTGAISFGDCSDPQSQVASLKARLRSYSLLAELNTKPRTTYLAKLRNPNPIIGAGG